MRTLELAQVDTDDYFAHMIFEDLRPIIRDIREAHKGDVTTADIPSPAEETRRLVDEALNYEGTPEEKVARVLLAQLDVDYDAITKEEFVTLIGILNKSCHMKRQISRRDKAHPSQGRKSRKQQINELNAKRTGGEWNFAHSPPSVSSKMYSLLHFSDTLPGLH